MSRCAHGRLAGERSTGTRPPVIVPALRASRGVVEVGERALDELRRTPRAAAAARRSRRCARRCGDALLARSASSLLHQARVGLCRARRCTAPVSVARSTMRARRPRRSRRHRQSAEHEPALGVGVVDLDRLAVRRPSTMSPGFIERPLGMFSVAPDDADRARTGSSERARSPPTASITAAPPDMSYFISAMWSPGFSEMPPLSNVTALPTKPSVGPSRRPGPRSAA